MLVALKRVATEARSEPSPKRQHNDPSGLSQVTEIVVSPDPNDGDSKISTLTEEEPAPISVDGV